MKVQCMYLWNVTYYIEPGAPAFRTALPNQVKALNFDEAKTKVEAYLESGPIEFDKIRVNGIQTTGVAVLE